MKNKRQEKILEIINKNEIQTQESIIAMLREAGFEVTQATVSRDIRELGIIKVSAQSGIYKYAVRDNDDSKQSAKYINIMRETVISADYANNLVVIKTFAGMAQAAAAAIDALLADDILGCIAGDDTIIAVAHDVNGAKHIVTVIKDQISGVN